MRIIVIVTLFAVLFLNGCVATSQKIITELDPEKKIGVIEKRDRTTVQVISEEEAGLISDKLFAQRHDLLLVAKTIYCRHEEWGKGYYSSYLEFKFRPPQELGGKASYIILTLRNASYGKKMYISIRAVAYECAFLLPATPEWMRWGQKQIADLEGDVEKEWS